MTRLVLHIGMPKTGTSSFQAWCGSQRERLADAGVLYPSSLGPARHWLLSLLATPVDELHLMPGWHRLHRTDPEVFQAETRAALIDEIKAADLPTVLLSDEGFFGASHGTLRAMAELAASVADELEVVVYLRRQDDHLVSNYQQRVKTGATDLLAERVDAPLGNLYDYAGRLGLWQRLVSPARMNVRVFERDRLAGGTLLSDFLTATAIDLDPATVPPLMRLNETLDAESVEFIRLMNLFRVEHRGRTAAQIQNAGLIAALMRRPDRGRQPIGLPLEAQQRFLDRWQAGNEAVARTWLGRADGQLFAPPVASSEVETRQLLEVDRVSELLELTKLPDRAKATVRRIAAREAERAG